MCLLTQTDNVRRLNFEAWYDDLRGSVVSSIDESILGPPDPEHPICPNCDVPMWMMKVENFGSGDEQRQHRIYECQLCGTKSIIPPLHAD